MVEPSWKSECREDLSLLPPELLREVLVRLDPRSLVQVSRTCRFLRHACNDEEIWKRWCKDEGIASNVVSTLPRQVGDDSGGKATRFSWVDCYRLCQHQKKLGPARSKKDTEEAERRHEVGPRLTRCLGSRDLDCGQNGVSFFELFSCARRKLFGVPGALLGRRSKSRGHRMEQENGTFKSRAYLQVMRVPNPMKAKIQADFVLMNRIEKLRAAE